MKLNAVFAAGALAFVLTVAAQAGTLVGAIPDDVLNAARGYGSATLGAQANGDPQVTGTVNGITYQIYFRHCTDHKDCEDLNFYLGFLDVKPTMEVINAWNRDKRYSRAYLDQDNDAVVAMDLDMTKGISPEYLDSQIALWTLVMDQFADHIGFKK